MIIMKDGHRTKRKKIVVRKRFYIFVFILLFSIVSLIRCSIKPDDVEDYNTVAFAERESDKEFTICIDAGHGDHDVGSQNKEFGIFEKDIVLDVALKVGNILEDNNVGVIYTRNTDRIYWDSQLESLKERSKISNTANVDYFVSIHTNYYEKSSKIKGTEVWSRFRNTEDEKLAKSISEKLQGINYTEDRGLKYEEEKKLYVLRNTYATSVLVELGYLSNRQDTKYLMTEKGRQAIAKAIAMGIIEYHEFQEIEIIESKK